MIRSDEWAEARLDVSNEKIQPVEPPLAAFRWPGLTRFIHQHLDRNAIRVWLAALGIRLNSSVDRDVP
jgi:hypothetical protein